MYYSLPVYCITVIKTNVRISWQKEKPELLKEIDAEIKEYSDLLVIESNRYRIKTQIELLREADSLEIILKPLARGHQIAGKKLDLCQNSDKPIDTKKEVSKAIGTSHDTLYKLKTIQKEKPELLKEIDAEIKEYSDLLVIESNRYREKTWTEKLKEAEALELILKPKAKEQQIRKSVCEKFPKQNPIDTGKEVADAIGISDRTLDKVKFIAKEKPELLKEIDAEIKEYSDLLVIESNRYR